MGLNTDMGKNQKNMPMIKFSVVILILMTVGFFFLVFQLMGTTTNF